MNGEQTMVTPAQLKNALRALPGMNNRCASHPSYGQTEKHTSAAKQLNCTPVSKIVSTITIPALIVNIEIVTLVIIIASKANRLSTI